MKTLKQHIISLAAIVSTLMLSSLCIAQDYKNDMMQIRSAFKNKYHSFAIKYIYYPYDSIKKATDSILGTCIMDSTSWYYKIRNNTGVVEYLKNGKYFLEVNHSNKVILLSKNSAAKSDLWDISRVDSMLRTSTVQNSYKEKNGEGEYMVTFEEGTWNKMRLVFNKERHTLDAIWLYSFAKGKIMGEPYNKPAIAILYTGYKETLPARAEFDEKKYVQETPNGNFEVAGAFKGFKLIDYVHKKT